MTRSVDHDPTAPGQLLNRYQGNWHQRLAVGLTLDSEFRFVDSCLILCKGCGKWLQYQWSEHRRVEIPRTITAECERIAKSSGVTLGDFLQIKTDLSEVMSVAARSAISLSGKAADRLLAIGVTDPGLWTREFDGRANYQSFCDPDRLADATGLTVIDAFPARDVASGGKGGPIDLLPLWLLYADRDAKVALEIRVVLRLTETLHITLLPASDGLDEEIPAIRHCELKIGKLLEQVLGRASRSRNLADFSPKVAIDGCLLEKMNRDSSEHEVQLLFDQSTSSLATKLATIAEYINGKFLKMLTSHRSKSPTKTKVQQECSPVSVYMFAKPEVAEAFKQVLGETLTRQSGDPIIRLAHLHSELNHHSLPPALAGVLGLMHLDQMPASLPWINGADSPRTLGRITPGSPNNWRQVIINMADFRPPAMKLRDAI